MNIHGFRHVSITPARVSRSPVLLESVGADSNNRNLLVYLPDGLHGSKPIQAGHFDIHQYDIGRRILE